ncbi:Flagellar attachment zone protein 1 [Diplonema papillatum]|nr:Flagellar attachment zone protein 1 [Diplonema papillatum]
MQDLQRSRSWGTGRSKGSVRSGSPFDTNSAVSRYEANQSMRERAANMWLEQLREKHERRRDAARRSHEIKELQKNHTQSRIEYQEAMFEYNRSKRNEQLDSKSQAYQERQNYLHEARNHAELMAQHKQQVVDAEVSIKLETADRNHKEKLQEKISKTHYRNQARAQQARMNSHIIQQQHVHKSRAKLAQEEQRQQLIEDQRRREDEERALAAEEKEMQRQEAIVRAEQIAAMKRMGTEAKLQQDGHRSASVLRRREEWIARKQEQNRIKQEQVRLQVAHAHEMRKAKERQYETHFQESIAIGTETAEHNKMFKLNNKIMHELMQGMIHDANARSRSSARRS